MDENHSNKKSALLNFLNLTIFQETIKNGLILDLIYILHNLIYIQLFPGHQ